MVRTTSAILAIASIGLVSAAPVQRREVPQEHSHEFSLRICNKFLKLDNPDGILDCVFGLLGNAAAETGIGNFAGGPDCLQTGTADRAFTNAKAAGDIEGMTHTLIYRAAERNTGRVGLESVLCTEFTPVNPEVAALSQHQDPASPNAAATNKAITLELARQIASFGGDPLDALQSGTFAPGDVNDPTAAGNTCDDPNDAAGCIISRGLLVEDATPEEIAAAVSGVTPPAGGGQGADGGQDAGAGGDQGADAPADCPPPATSTVTVTATAAPTATDDAGVCTVPTTTTVTVTANAGGATPAPSSATGGGNASSTTAANPPAQTGALSFGTCKNPTIEFGRGLPGRGPNELAFQPADQVNFQHGAALGLGVIMDSNCNNLVNRCGLKNTDPAFQACQAAKAEVLALGTNNGAAADRFNELLGFTTDFARLDGGNAKRRRALRRRF